MTESGHSLVWRLLSRETRLKWKDRNLQRHYAEAIRRARKAGDYAEAEELEREEMHEVLTVREESDSLYTAKLLDEARQLRVPIPDWHDAARKETGYWEAGTRTGHHYLTTAGVALVRKAIRAERRARWEERGHVLAWITAITGLVGTLTGLLAVWLTGR